MANDFLDKAGKFAYNTTLPGIMDYLFPNPANKAMPFLNEIPGQVSPYYEPYSQRGQRIAPQLEEQFGRMSQDPSEFYNRISGGYKESPGLQTRLRYGQKAAEHAFNAAGMGGTPEHALIAAQNANDLYGNDFQNYLSNVLGIQQRGQAGQLGLEEQGYNAGNELGNFYTGLGTNKAALAYGGQQNQNLMRSQILQSLIKMLGGASTGGAAAAGGLA